MTSRSNPRTAANHVLPLHPGLAAGGAAMLVLTFVLGLVEVRFFTIFTFELAWWSLIFLLDGILWLRRGRSPLTTAPGSFALLCLWSVAFWLFFEILNLRLENWYYINVWAGTGMRWLTSFLAFATVLPAVFLTAEVLRSFLPAPPPARRRRRTPPWLMKGFFGLGLVCLVAPLLWPGYCYALIWLGVFLLLEPLAFRPEGPSLLGEWERGTVRSLLLYLAAGLVCGLFWEAFNHGARVKWIYTVPFFEQLKLFEMPVMGFLGFPPFAVECWIFMVALERLGLGIDWSVMARGEATGRRPRLGTRLAIAVGTAIIVCAAALPGMDRKTVASCYPSAAALAPHLEALGIPAPAGARAGLDAFALREALEGAPPSPETRRLDPKQAHNATSGVERTRGRSRGCRTDALASFLRRFYPTPGQFSPPIRANRVRERPVFTIGTHRSRGAFRFFTG